MDYCLFYEKVVNEPSHLNCHSPAAGGKMWLTLFPFSKPGMVADTLKTTVTHHQPISVGSWDWEDTEHLVLQNIITIIT